MSDQNHHLPPGNRWHGPMSRPVRPASGSPDPSRVLVVGDTHGNADFVGHVAGQAAHLGCPVVLQVGDFGFWSGPGGRRFLDLVEWHLARADLRLVWVRGNHEHHGELGAMAPDNDGFVTVRPRIRHAPDGLRWTWGGRSFGALGGAYSVDRRRRVKGKSWWPTEVPTEVGLARLGTDPLEVLVTHDAPSGVPLSGLSLPPTDEALAEEVRQVLGRAVAATTPSLVLHGHWHQRHSHELTWVDPDATRARGEMVWQATQVEGLASDIEGDGRAWGVLDLETLAFTDGRALS